MKFVIHIFASFPPSRSCFTLYFSIPAIQYTILYTVLYITQYCRSCACTGMYVCIYARIWVYRRCRRRQCFQWCDPNNQSWLADVIWPVNEGIYPLPNSLKQAIPPPSPVAGQWRISCRGKVVESTVPKIHISYFCLIHLSLSFLPFLLCLWLNHGI